MPDKIRTYAVQAEGLGGPCVWTDLAGALEEIRMLVDPKESDSEPGFSVTIRVGEMTRDELDALPEFTGY